MVLTCLNVNSITDKDDQPEPYTKFNTLNFYAENIDWVNIKKNLQKINWIEKLDSEDPNEILETINTICYKTCKNVVPKRSSINNNKKRSKVERHRRSLIKRRRKITKRYLQCNSKTRKSKIKEELLQIEKNLQKSFNDSKQYVENKAIESIKKNSKYFFSYARKEVKNWTLT